MSVRVVNPQSAIKTILPEVWERGAIASSLSNSIVNANVNTTRDTLVAIRAGLITGMRVDLDTTVTAGTITWKVSVNGSATALTVTCSSGTNPTGGTSTSAGIAYAAGDTIGMLLDSTAGVTPTTIAGSSWIEVQI